MSEAPTEPRPGDDGRRRRAETLLRRGMPLVAAGALGAGIAVGIGAAVDSGGGTTTVIQATPAVGSTGSGEQEAALGPAGESLSVQEIYRRTAPGVVQITAVSPGETPTDPFAQPDGLERALGSGFVIDTAGHIVTNYHVVQGAEEVQVNFSGGDAVPAKVVGVDSSTDVAVLEVDVPARALTPLPLGNSDEVQVGDPVVAIGNPFGLDRTVTAGIVSAVQRHIQAPDGFTIDNVIQTDAAINRGNSGGPLLDSQGEVIGVNSQIETGGVAEGNVGVGFAVPINTVREVASQLIESGTAEHAFVGIEMQTISPELAENFRLPAEEGVLVTRVLPGSPAAEAGLRGGDTTVVINGETWILGGDVITQVDGRAVSTADELREVVIGKRPGDTITLEVQRDGSTRDVTVELGRRPVSPSD